MVKWRNIIFPGYWLMVIILFSGCAKSPEAVNQSPLLTLTQTSDGLQVTVKGSATDPDGTATSVSIAWGDQQAGDLPAKDIPGFEISHLYAKPGNYDIIITARDDAGADTRRILSFSADFREISLNGIRPSLYKSSPGEYLVLTLNLHTYQEARQLEKLMMIADVIGKMDIDFICFQECAQSRYAAISSGIIREDNTALLISGMVGEKYHFTYPFSWAWSHYGWDVYEEGVAVLSKYAITQAADRYISTNTSTGSITSRKVIWASCQAPGGLFHIFSAHTHWRTSLTDEEQNTQIRHIKSMVAEKENASPGALSFACGDFNGNPTDDYPWSEGYNTMMATGDYADTFLEANPGANQKPGQSIYNTIGGDFPGRIDYIFMKQSSRMQVSDSQIIFTPDIVGLVSDHFGVLTKVVVN